MTDSDFNKYPSLASTNDLEYDDGTFLDNKLTLLIKLSKIEIDVAMNNLIACGEENEFAIHIVNLINFFEILQMHFELTREVLRSNSDEEVNTIKEKYCLIKNDYQKLKSKNDLTLIPLISLVNFYSEAMVGDVKRVLNCCFKKTSDSEIQLLKTEDNTAKIIIIKSRLEVGIEYFPRVVTYPKDDIFSSEKSSPVWQDVLKCAIFKQNLTRNEIKAAFKPFNLFVHVTQTIIANHMKGEFTPSLTTVFALLRDLIYYGSQATKAETQALLYLTNPSVEHAFKGWHILDHPLFNKLISLRFPKMGFDGLVYIPRLFPQITKDTILNEYKEGTINKIQPVDSSQLIGPNVQSLGPEIVESLLEKSDDCIPVRILSMKPLNLGNSSTQKNLNEVENNILHEQAIVIHIHGGGFVSMSSASHRIYLTKWVKELKLIHFCIDYRLAPKNQYPDALDDVWQAYLWIIRYSETVLRIKHAKVILTGDSAGGNLVMALTLRLIRAGLPPPTGCLLIYPALLLDITKCTPSYYNALTDPVLHYNLLRLCVRSYVNDIFDASKDPFLSPSLASDELLKKLPPIRIISGSEDPLHDDCWRFAAKLRKFNKDVKIIVHDGFSHGFMSFQDMKNYKLFVKEDCDLIRELIDSESSIA